MIRKIQQHFQDKIKSIQKIFVKEDSNATNQNQIQNKLKSGSLKALILYYSSRQFYNVLSNFEDSKVVNRQFGEKFQQIIKQDQTTTRKRIEEIITISKAHSHSAHNILNQKSKRASIKIEKDHQNISDLSIVDEARNSMCLFGQSFLNKGNISKNGNNNEIQDITQNMNSNITFNDRKLSLECLKRHSNNSTHNKESRRKLIYQKVENRQNENQQRHQSLQRVPQESIQKSPLNNNYSQKNLVTSKYYIANHTLQIAQQKQSQTHSKTAEQIKSSLQKYRNSPQSIVTHNKLISRSAISTSKNRLVPTQQNKLLEKVNRPLLLKNNVSLGNVLSNKLTITNKSTLQSKNFGKQRYQQSPKESQVQQYQIQKKQSFQQNLHTHFRKYSVLENYQHFDQPISFAREHLKQRTQRSVTVPTQNILEKPQQQNDQDYKNTFRKIDSISNKISHVFASKALNQQNLRVNDLSNCLIDNNKQASLQVAKTIKNETSYLKIETPRPQNIDNQIEQVCRNFQDLKRQHEQNQREIRRRDKITIDDLATKQQKQSNFRMNLKTNETKSVPHLSSHYSKAKYISRQANTFVREVSNTIDTYHYRYQQILSPKQVKKLIEEKSKSKYSAKQSSDKQKSVEAQRGKMIRQFQVSPVQIYKNGDGVLKQNDMNSKKPQKTPVKESRLQQMFAYNPKGSIIDQIYSNEKSFQQE